MNPVMMAVLAQKWSQLGVRAQIHALTGMDTRRLVNYAGKILWTAIDSAIRDGLDIEQPDMRIVRGGVNAVYDQFQREAVDESLRQPILSGLEAAERLLAQCKQKTIVQSVIDLDIRLRRGMVGIDDFQELIHANH